MGKGQTNVSLPKSLMDWIEILFEENREVFAKWGVDSAPKVARVLIEHGKTPLEQILAAIKAQEKKQQTQTETDMEREE